MTSNTSKLNLSFYSGYRRVYTSLSAVYCVYLYSHSVDGNGGGEALTDMFQKVIGGKKV